MLQFQRRNFSKSKKVSAVKKASFLTVLVNVFSLEPYRILSLRESRIIYKFFTSNNTVVSNHNSQGFRQLSLVIEQ